MFLMYFCSLLLEKRILLDFLGYYVVPCPCCEHCCWRFLVLSHFVFMNNFHFHRHTMVMRSD